MSQYILVELEMPTDLEKFKLPQGVDERLQALLDRQDRGEGLTPAERAEAEGLVDLAELLALLRLRAQSVWQEGQEATCHLDHVVPVTAGGVSARITCMDAQASAGTAALG